MYKKILSALLMTALFTLSFASLAFAQEQPPADRESAARLNLGFGELTAVGSDNFMVKNQRGEFRVYVMEETRCRTRDGEEIGLDDLEVGRWVAGAVRKDQDGRLAARLVVLLPEDFDPGQLQIQ